MQSFFVVLILVNIVLGSILISNDIAYWDDRMFISTVAELLAITSLAFILAILNSYSIGHLLIYLGIKLCVCVCMIISKRMSAIKLLKILIPCKGSLSIAMAVGMIIFAVLYLKYPIYYMWGRRDPALYFLMGVNISKTGSIIPQSNTIINESYNQIKDFADLSFRGVFPNYLNDTFNGDYSATTFQFLHFFSSYLSIGYSLGGLETLIRFPAIVGLLCVWGCFCFVKNILGERYGLLAAVVLGLCPAQLWGARITQTEEMCQLIIWLIALIQVYAYIVQKRKLYVVIGILIGLTCFIRIDSFMFGIGLIICAIFTHVVIGDDTRWNNAILGYVFTSVMAFICDYMTSTEYIQQHGPGNIYPIIALTFLVCLLYLALRIFQKKNNTAPSILSILNRKKFLVLSLIISYLLFKFLWIIRPTFQKGADPSYDFWQRCFIEIFYYVPVLFYPLTVIAIVRIPKNRELFEKIGFFFFNGIICASLYIYKPSIAPDHIWASRRWTTMVFPFLIVMSVIGIKILFERLRLSFLPETTGVVVLGIFICLFLLDRDKLFINKRLLSELPAEYEELVSYIDDDKLYFAEMSHFGSYLRFYYGKNIVLLDADKEDAFLDYVNDSAQPVYYIGSITSLKNKYQYETIHEEMINATYLHQISAGYPNELQTITQPVNIYKILSSW